MRCGRLHRGQEARARGGFGRPTTDHRGDNAAWSIGRRWRRPFAGVSTVSLLATGLTGVVTAFVPGAVSTAAKAAPPPSAVTEFQPDLSPARRWGGRTVAISVDPGDVNTAIAASESGGLFRTTNQGDNWTHIDTFLPFRMADVKYAPGNRRVVIATVSNDSGRKAGGSGILRSTDGGATWQKPATSAPACNARAAGYGIAFQPASTNVYVGTDCGIAVSTDLGATWQHREAGIGRVTSMAAAQGGTVYACGNNGLRRSTDSGATFALRTLPAGENCPTVTYPWVATHAIAVSPVEADVLFLSTGANEGWESDDGGNTWTNLNVTTSGARQPYVSLNRSANGNPAHIDVYIGGGNSTQRQTCTGSAPATRCGIGGFANVTAAHADQHEVAFTTVTTGTGANCALYMVSDGGVHRTTDCGANFLQVGGGPGGFNALQVYEIAGQIHPDHTDLYFGTQDNDVWASGDNGATWTGNVCCEGWYFQIPRTSADHAGQQITYEACGACVNLVSTAHLGSTANWNHPPPGAMFSEHPFLLEPGVFVELAQPGLVGGGTDPTFQLYLTTDSGGTWAAVNGATIGLGVVERLWVSGPPGDPTIYQTVARPGGVGLVKILGARSPSATVVNADTGLGRIDQWCDGQGSFRCPAAFGVDPNDPLHLIAADAGTDQVKISLDGGASWTPNQQLTDLVTANGAFDFDGQTHAIAFNPTDSNLILVGTEAAGIMASTDGGQSWGKLPGSERIPVVTSFFFDEVQNDIIVSSYGRGLWKLEVPEADLAVTKTHRPDPAIAGEQLYYDVTVTNNGPDAAPAVVVTDTLDPKVSYVTSTLTAGGVDACTANSPPPGTGQTVTCQVGDLASGGSTTFTIKVAVAPDAVSGAGQPTQIVNTVSVSAVALEDPDESNNSHTDVAIVEDRADLEVTKLCKPDTNPRAGEPITCTVFVDNHGPSYARQVVVDDEMLSNGTFTITDVTPALGPGTPGCTLSNVAGGQKLTCRLGDLANATTSSPGRAKVTYTINTTEGQDINNVATVRSDTPDPDATNNTTMLSLTVESVADLALTKAGPASAVAGGPNISYDLTVTNNGPSTATNVVITDDVPAGVTIVSVSAPGGTCNAGAPGDPFRPTTCALGTMAPSAVETMQVTVHVEPDTLGILHNDARVSSDTFDDDIDDNLATVATNVTASADLSIAKSDSPDPVVAGEELTYTIVVTNDGPSTATDVKVTDTLPAGTSFVSGVDGNGATVCALVQAATVVCDLGTMGPGTSKTVYLTVFVDPSVPDGATLTNTATVSSPTPDPNGANNTDQETTDVDTSAELWLDKTGTLRSGNPSPVLVYSLFVHNDAGCEADAESSPTPTCGEGGPSDAQDVIVTDTLPLDPKKLVVQYVSPQCTYTTATHTVVCTSTTVPAGAKVEFVIEAQVQGSVGTISNTATLTSATPDPVAANNTDSVDVVVKGGTGKRK